MIQTIVATNFIIETKNEGKELKCRCELLDKERWVWKCEFPRGMSLLDIVEVIEELFFECEDIKTSIIKFNFNGANIIVKKDVMISILEEIAQQLKVK